MTRDAFIRGFGFVGLPLILLVVLVLMSSQGRAEAYDRSRGGDVQAYVGLDTQVSHISYSGQARNELEDFLLGFSGYAGVRVHDNAGVEVSYAKTLEGDERFDRGGAVSDSQAELEMVAIDAIAYSPIGSSGRFELMGIVGVSHTTFTSEVRSSSGQVSVRESSEFAPRFGTGVHYAVSDRVNMRGVARWQSSDFDGIADGSFHVGVGLSYNL